MCWQWINILEVLKAKGTCMYYFICIELSAGKIASKVTEFTVDIT